VESGKEVTHTPAPTKPEEVEQKTQKAQPSTVLINGKIGKPKQTDKGIWFTLGEKQVYAPSEISITAIHVDDECELEVVPSKTSKGTEYFRLVRIAAVVKDEPEPPNDIDAAAAELFQEKTA
jgi:hypothetical protein